MDNKHKLTPELAKKIRTEYNDSFSSLLELAEKFNISYSAVRDVLRGNSYPDDSWENEDKRPLTLGERLDDVLAMRAEGKSFAAIGKELGRRYRGRQWSGSAVASAIRHLEDNAENQ